MRDPNPYSRAERAYVAAVAAMSGQALCPPELPEFDALALGGVLRPDAPVPFPSCSEGAKE